MSTSKQKTLLKAASRHSFCLLIFFLSIMSYMCGSVYRSSERASNLGILFVDHDSGLVGESALLAYSQLKGPSFVSLHYRPASEFEGFSSITKAVCLQEYWGAVYIHANATRRLIDALAGNGTQAYNSTDAMAYVYSGVRYPVIAQSFVAADLQRLVSATSQALHDAHGNSLLLATNQTDPLAVSALLQPISSSVIILHPMLQGTRILLNTITMVVAPLMQFFFVMALDHNSAALSVFKESETHTLFLRRLFGSKAFAFLAGLPVAAFTYAFKEDWALSSGQFVETWLCWAFYMDISYLIMDSVIGTLVPLKYAPFFIFGWVVVNVTGTVFPFELNPGFYKLGYALPAHNVWYLLMQIWSRGCVSQLDVALPVLFVWWLIGSCTSAVAVWRKCGAARRSTSSAVRQ